MFEKIVCSIVFSVVAFTGFGQNLQTGTEYWYYNQGAYLQPSTKSSTVFNQSGMPEKTIYLEWDNNLKSLCTELVTTFQYDDAHRLIQERKKEEGQPISQIKDYKNYFYSGGDCLSKVIESDTTEGGFIVHITTTFDSINCRPISKNYSSGTSENINPSTIVFYEYDGNIETERFYNPWPPNSPFRIKKINEVTRDDEGQIIKTFITVYNNQEETRYRDMIYFEYDDNNNETSKIEFHSNQNDTSFYLLSETITEYTYNEEDNILELNTIISNYDPPNPNPINITTSKDIYEYYCDGLLNRIVHFGSSSDPFAYTTMQYQEGHDCDLPKETDYLNLRPNFTANKFMVESSLLQNRDCQIAVYDMLGNQVMSVPSPGRAQVYYLNINHLSSGYYVVHISDGQHSQSEFVLKL